MGVHPNAYRWFAEGTLPVPARRLASGTIVVEEPAKVDRGRTIASLPRLDLERASSVRAWRDSWPTGQPFGSSSRPRPARKFGLVDLAAALSASGRQILVVHYGEVNDDLSLDVTRILTALSARLYGRKGARRRALRALSAANAGVA